MNPIEKTVHALFRRFEFSYTVRKSEEHTDYMGNIFKEHPILYTFCFVGEGKPANPEDDWEDEFNWPWSINVHILPTCISLNYNSGITRGQSLPNPDFDDEETVIGFLLTIAGTLINYVAHLRAIKSPSYEEIRDLWRSCKE